MTLTGGKKTGFCSVCSLGVTVDYMLAHAQVHIKENEDYFAKYNKQLYEIPIAFYEAARVTGDING